MPSHGAREIVDVADLGGGRARVRFRLECGCERTDDVPDDRLIDTPDGGRVLVGKYPCPAGHPVRRPD